MPGTGGAGNRGRTRGRQLRAADRVHPQGRRSGVSAVRNVRDAVVIGGGPTGLTLAIALRRYGIDTVVVDKSPGTKRESRASVIWQRALEAMRDLGCADALMGEGLPLSRAEFHVRGRPAGSHEMHMPDTAYPGPLSIEQDAVERLLHDRLRQLGPDVQWSTEAVAVRLGEDSAEVDLRGPDGHTRTVGCRWVIGCEGSRSIVRKSLGVPFEGERRPDLQCLQLNAKPDWSLPYDPAVTHIFINHGVTLIADAVPGGATRFFAFCPDPDPTLQRPPTQKEMESTVARATGEAGVRLVPTDPHWANRSRFQDRLAVTLRRGQALLAGDSAHLWAPIGGRGLNTSLLGAHNLGWKLAAVHHGWAPDALLDTYSTEQRHTAREVMRHMRRNVLELPPNRPTLAAIGLLLPHVLRSERMGHQGSLLLSDFARNHRASALSTGRGGRGGPRPGDRLPDLAVTSETGPARLHDLLSYQRWSLLLTGDGGDSAELRKLTEKYVMPIALFRIRTEPPSDGTLLLVRPDGHIGLRARTSDDRALRSYLDRWFVRRK
ncbi:FAD-dependent monooxygenase [Streptomyces sp. NPDC020667]|uniref:FAD-dependent monooxygenase n=1 Tax=Streptomyces sp. NPDC020667 TaxID=3154895 RepID=UPI00340C456B